MCVMLHCNAPKQLITEVALLAPLLLTFGEPVHLKRRDKIDDHNWHSQTCGYREVVGC